MGTKYRNQEEFNEECGFFIENHTLHIKEGVTDFSVDWESAERYLASEKISKIVCPSSVTYFDVPHHVNLTLKEVELAEGVQALGNAAFRWCKELKSIELPDSITEIPESCFEECVNLKHIKLGKNVKRIQEKAFYGCESLREIALSETIEEIHDEAFGACSRLSKVQSNGFHFENIHKDVFVDTLFLSRLRRKNPMVIHEGCLLDGTLCKGKVVVPEDVKHICTAAFKDNRLITGITFPESLLSISYSAFEGCTSLSNVSLPSGVEYVAQRLFKDCFSLETVDIPSQVHHFFDGAFDNTLWLKNQQMIQPMVKVNDCLIDAKKCKGVVRVEGVKTISPGAFAGNIDVTEVIIGEGVESIGNHAFLKCYFLGKITLPNSIKFIDKYAFNRCANLKEIVLPDGLETITKGMFFRCLKLEKVKLPSSLKKIEDDAFWGCSNLPQLRIDKSVEVGEDVFGKQKMPFPIRMTAKKAICRHNEDQPYNCVVKNASYKDREDIIEVIIPEGVEVIERYAFDGCENLLRVHLPESLKVIEEFAFYDCRSLADINLPSHLMRIGSRAFKGTSLRELELPESLVAIDYGAFEISSLRKLTINSDVSISSFGTCEKLYELTINGSITADDTKYPFSGCKNLMIVNCDDGKVRKDILRGHNTNPNKNYSFNDHTPPLYWSAFAIGFIAVAVGTVLSFFKGDSSLFTKLGWASVALLPSGLIVNKMVKLLGAWNTPREGKSSRLGQLLYAPALVMPAAIIGVPLYYFTNYPGLFCFAATSGAIVAIVFLVDSCLNLFKEEFALFFSSIYSFLYRVVWRKIFVEFIVETIIADFLVARVLSPFFTSIKKGVGKIYNSKLMKWIRRKVHAGLKYLVDKILSPFLSWLGKKIKAFFKFLWVNMLYPFFRFIKDVLLFIKHIVLDYILRPTIKLLIKAGKQVWLFLLRPLFRLLTRFFLFIYKHLALGFVHIIKELCRLVYCYLLSPIGRVLRWLSSAFYNYFLKYIFKVIKMQCYFLYRQLSHIFGWIFSDANGVVNYFITIPLLILAVVGAIVYYIWFR